MTTFIINWTITETNAQPQVAGTAQSPVYELRFDNKQEALAAYHKALAETDLTKLADLGYDPTDEEVRQHAVSLELSELTTDEDDEQLDIIENSEYYWLND